MYVRARVDPEPHATARRPGGRPPLRDIEVNREPRRGRAGGRHHRRGTAPTARPACRTRGSDRSRRASARTSSAVGGPILVTGRHLERQETALPARRPQTVATDPVRCDHPVTGTTSANGLPAHIEPAVGGSPAPGERGELPVRHDLAPRDSSERIDEPTVELGVPVEVELDPVVARGDTGDARGHVSRPHRPARSPTRPPGARRSPKRDRPAPCPPPDRGGRTSVQRWHPRAHAFCDRSRRGFAPPRGESISTSSPAGGELVVHDDRSRTHTSPTPQPSTRWR